MNAITILSQDIRQIDNLFSLNDLHRAAGSEKKHQPANWLRTEQTKELTAEIERSSDMRNVAIKRVKGGNPQLQGTYVCKELVYAYAMWISAKFNLLVIRAFDEMAKKLHTPETLSPIKYHYPRGLLAQQYFQTPKEADPRLSLSKLASKQFASPLGLMLAELQNDGHEVTACVDEYYAMKDRVQLAYDYLTQLQYGSLEVAIQKLKQG